MKGGESVGEETGEVMSGVRGVSVWARRVGN